jgi:DNA-binding NarL/FixJ family response regulator
MRAAENNDTKVNGATLLLADLRFAQLAPRLAQRHGVRVVASCARGADLVGTASELCPDVLLVAAESAGSLLGLGSLLRSLRLRARATKVLVVSERRDSEFVCTILRHGARGRVRPGAGFDELGKAILAVRNGDVWLERGVLSGTLIRLVQAQGARPPARKPLPADFRSTLTARESEIVAFVAEGLTNKEVARRLYVSHETIKKHLKKVFVKLGVRHRTEVILHYG